MSKILSRIPRTIKAIGIVSFLLNTSTLIVFSIFGIYLHDKLGVDLKKIGFLDGAVESFSFIIKIASGVVSDCLMNRKLLLFIGGFFLFIAKPLEATATTYWYLFQAKILERFGNGIQSTPRDAIVGDWAPKNIKGACFGFRQMLAALGSVTGSVLAFIFAIKSNCDYQFVFWLASIPSGLALIIIVFFIHDKKQGLKPNKKEQTSKKIQFRKITLSDIKSLGTQYWVLIAIACTYMISKVTESIVILYVIKTLKLPIYYGPVCMIFYQIANSFISYPAGVISDKLKKRENVFIAGIIIFLLSDILFIFGSNIITMIIALLFLGAYIGISQSIFPAKIIDIVPPHLKGTGIGIFNFVCAISFLIGGSMTGYIADNYSMKMSFVASSILAVLSLITLLLLKKIKSFSKD